MSEYFDGKILVAPPRIADWRFTKTVLYLWKHDVAGAAGCIINKPMNHPSFERVCTEAKVQKLKNINPMMYYGGPVMDNLIGCLHTTDYILTSTNIKKDINIGYTLDKKIIEDIASGIAKPKQYQMCIGIASWDAGQLEAEIECEPPRISGTSWLVLDYDPKLVFSGKQPSFWEHCLNLAIQQKTNSFTNKIFK